MSRNVGLGDGMVGGAGASETLPLLGTTVSPDEEASQPIAATSLAEVKKSDGELVLSAKSINNPGEHVVSPVQHNHTMTPLLHHHDTPTTLCEKNHEDASIGFYNKVYGHQHPQKSVIFATSTSHNTNINKLSVVGGKSLDAYDSVDTSLYHPPSKPKSGSEGAKKPQFQRTVSQDHSYPYFVNTGGSRAASKVNEVPSSSSSNNINNNNNVYHSTSISRRPDLTRQKRCDHDYTDDQNDSTYSMPSANIQCYLQPILDSTSSKIQEEPGRVSVGTQLNMANKSSGEDDQDSNVLPIYPRHPKCFSMPLQRALTLPSSTDHMLKSPMRKVGGPGVIAEEEGEDTIIDVPILTPIRSGSIDNNLMIIPTFTVTINPMEDNEITYIPESPSLDNPPKKMSIDGDTNMISDGNTSHISPSNADEEFRRSSIGSASSLLMEKTNLGIPKDLQIRRVSEISHINELRREVSGMDHLASEYYEITNINPDAISLDTIHQTIFKRCQNKYMPPQRSTTQNKCFVIIASGFILLGIIYGFWYKNFGPGSDGGSGH